MNRNLVVFLIIIIAVISTVTIWSQKKSESSSVNDSKIQVTTSFYPLWFFAREIGEDKVNVQNITPAGAEPHEYEPTTQDLARIEKSQLLILNGAVETWGDKIKNNLQSKNVKIIVAGEGLFTEQLEEEGKVGIDPHIWLSPLLAKKESEKISQTLQEIDSANTPFYQQNQKTLTDKFDQLDQSYRTGLSNCQSKDIITSHAAFNYLAKTYGLNQVPIAGLSTEEEPSTKQLAEVADFAKNHGVKYIFFESLVSPKLAETLAKEVGAQTLVLDPIEGLSKDDINARKNYFTVMQQNLNNLKIALNCQ